MISVLNLSLSLIATISSGSSFQKWEAVGKNVLLWPAVFEDGIATAVWRYVDAWWLFALLEDEVTCYCVVLVHLYGISGGTR